MLRRTVLLLFLLVNAFLAQNVLAQDSVYYVEIVEGMATADGSSQPVLHKVWISDQNVRATKNDEEYFIMDTDSLYLVNTYTGRYAVGPVARLDYLWMRLPGNSDLREWDSIATLEKTGRKRSIGQYRTEQSVTRVRKETSSIPLLYEGWASPTVELPDSLLAPYYRALKVRHTEISTDLPKIYEIYERESLLPIYIILAEMGAADNEGRFVSRIKRVDQVPFHDSLFTVPEGYKYVNLVLPPEEMLEEELKKAREAQAQKKRNANSAPYPGGHDMFRGYD